MPLTRTNHRDGSTTLHYPATSHCPAYDEPHKSGVSDAEFARLVDEMRPDRFHRIGNDEVRRKLKPRRDKSKYRQGEKVRMEVEG